MASTTTTPLFEEPSPSATITQGRSSVDLFPTGATGTSAAATATATATASSSFGRGTTPSLYLIVFLSILVLLLITSMGIAVRAVYFRRRFRNNVDRAIRRGDFPPDWAAPGSAGLYDYSWWRSMGMARFFGPDLDADDFTGFTPGDWRHSTGGRRRKHRKDYGEIPVLYEAQVFEAEDSHPDNGFESGWECKQPLAVATPHERLSHLLQARNVDLESHERVNVASTRRIEDINAPVLSYNNNHDVTHSNASRGSDTGEHSLQVRYLIRMPESQIAIASRNQPDEYGEIVSHGPIEIGVWQPLIDLQAESKLDDDNSRGDLNKGNILQ